MKNATHPQNFTVAPEAITYEIEKKVYDEKGLVIAKETIVKGLKSEERALSWLDSSRMATIQHEANGRHVTEIEKWTFNVLASAAKGDRVVINYSIKFLSTIKL